jgi:hypothetical protein
VDSTVVVIFLISICISVAIAFYDPCKADRHEKT